jgi:hypothetical protein
MQVVKRIAVLLIEAVAEALLLGCLLGALVSSETGVLYGVVGSILAVPVALFLNGYYLTRALAGVAWKSRLPWLYPLLAAGIFLVHVSFVISHSRGDFTPFARATAIPFLAGGTCIVYVCALGGNWLMRKWTRRDNGPSLQRHSILPGNAGG